MNKIKAPQRKLQSSWQSEVFKKAPKRGTVVNYSRSGRGCRIVKTNGNFVANNTCNTGYLY
jgi:hypothetical protein